MQKQMLASGSAVAGIRNGVAIATVDAPKARQIHKVGEMDMSAYFPAEVKALLPMVHAKTGNNVNECLAEALRDLFRKYIQRARIC